MNNGLVIADAGPIFSLALIDHLDLLTTIFEEVIISNAVWNEIILDNNTVYYERIRIFFQESVISIKGFNELSVIMDPGESESIILYKEINADFLLIDDKKARRIAENFGINCVGTLGILSIAKERGIIDNLRSIFETFLDNHRYYSIELLNAILEKYNEEKLNQ